ncbi:hypothetical protein KBI23_21790 [bacterium]|nr:hypothetical protein [bacterium]MBP9810785.1 hypothetical protein [bacterium]
MVIIWNSVSRSERLALGLKSAIPEVKGFSARNRCYMKAFAESYPNSAFLQAPPAKMTWYHNIPHLGGWLFCCRLWCRDRISFCKLYPLISFTSNPNGL